jgi:hypothetical protein
MTLYSAPAIQTNWYGNDPEQLPDSASEQLQRATVNFEAIPGDPSYERRTGIDSPDVPYVLAWYKQPQSDTQLIVEYPLSMPQVVLAPVSWSQDVLKAAQVQNQMSNIGVIGSLRAPGINEGL